MQAFVLHYSPRQLDLLINGGADGADSLAAQWARDNGIEVMTVIADWRTHGKKAGPMRNEKMIRLGQPDLVVAFPGGRGTEDVIRRAKANDIPVLEIPDEEYVVH
jgi:predicted Rossmann-fold nucleotide-binding protein